MEGRAMRITFLTEEGDTVSITFRQLLGMAALRPLLDVDHWHTCANGCCVLIHEVGKDETAWRVSEDGSIDKMDRYGNIVMHIDAPDDLDEPEEGE